MVVTGLTRNQLYLFWYRGFESHRLRHIMARCEPQNKKATSVAFFILLLFARHYNCSDGGRPKYVTLDFHLAIPSLRSLRIPRLYHSVVARRHITRQAKRLPFIFTPATRRRSKAVGFDFSKKNLAFNACSSFLGKTLFCRAFFSHCHFYIKSKMHNRFV